MRATSLMLMMAIACDSAQVQGDERLGLDDDGAWLVEEAEPFEASPALPMPPPVPTVMGLTSTDWHPGQTAILTATDAIPGAKVFFIQGAGLGMTCHPKLGGDCLDIVGIDVLGSAFADGGGVATLATVVSAAAPSGSDVFLQAVVPAGAPYASEVAELVVDGAATVDFSILVEGGKVYKDDPACSCDWDADPFGLFNNPDPFFAVWVDGDFVGTSATDQDTRFPVWNTFADVTVEAGSYLFIDVWDDDSGVLGADDFVGTVTLSDSDLQGLVDGGPVQVGGDGALLWLDLDVSSL